MPRCLPHAVSEMKRRVLPICKAGRLGRLTMKWHGLESMGREKVEMSSARWEGVYERSRFNKTFWLLEIPFLEGRLFKRHHNCEDARWLPTVMEQSQCMKWTLKCFNEMAD